MNFPVFDLHCDTALALTEKNDTSAYGLYQNSGHIDLERAGKFPGYCQCFACFTTPLMEENPQVVFEKELRILKQELENNSHLIKQAYCKKDILDNCENGLMSAVFTIEGPAGIGFDPERLQTLYQMGFRITTLGWNEKNPLTGSHQTGGGLTDLGREYVKEAQRLGMIIDVSHISDEGFWDIINMTQAPIIATHSNSRAVYDVSRNLTDDMFRAICQTGGVAGFNQYASFIGDYPDLDTICRHFLHFMEMDPGAEHIALGGDLDGCDVLSSGFSGIQDYPSMADKLLEHGLSKENLKDIYWNNAMGVIERCCM